MSVDTPTKWALTKIRQRIEYTFFKEILFNLLLDFEVKRKIFKGLRVYAIDGFQVHLPRAEDITKAGYNGRSVSQYRESYTPRMYLLHAYDVLSGVTKDIREAPLLNEQQGAKNMIKNFEKNSVTLYDRLYISYSMIKAHKLAGNYFMMRARKSSFKVVREFYSSHKQYKSTTIEGLKVYLIKVPNPKKGRKEIFVTNLPKSWHDTETIQRLYNLRWEVENSFRDLKETMKLEQWHSKFINGIRQELYATFWLYNFVRIKMNYCMKNIKTQLSEVYEKANFKLILSWIKINLDLFYKKKRGLNKYIFYLINLSTEKRKHYSRSYKREIKSPASPYKYNNTVWVL